MTSAKITAQRKLYEREVTDWKDEELISELTTSYAPTEVPPCRVCGGPLSCQSIGGGPTIWACSGTDEDGKRLPGRSMADEHYSQSQWHDGRRGGDDRVMEMIRRLRESHVAIHNLRTGRAPR